MDERLLPFYLIGHNPNTIPEATAYLKAGANALEPDVQRFNGQLWVAHNAGPMPGQPMESYGTPLDRYLEQLVSLSNQFPLLSLIYFDSKLDDYASGAELHMHVQNILGSTGLTVLYSAGRLGMSSFLQPIAAGLGSREAVMIDEEGDVSAVLSKLTGYGAQRIGYGDGIMVAGVKPSVHREIDQAIATRALDVQRRPQFIGTWTLASKRAIADYLRTGVDGIIVNIDTVPEVLQYLKEPDIAAWRPLARRNDNLFSTVKGGRQWVLDVTTLPRDGAGTDARVTISLRGSGPARVDKIIDAGVTGRLESGDITSVTLLGANRDVGDPVSVVLSHDGTGNRPDWLPDRLSLRESGRPALYVDVGVWVEKGKSVECSLGTASYVLLVETSDIASAGTDADITFTINGTVGSVRRRINSHFKGWFERGDTNKFDVRGIDVGQLISLHIDNDGSANGPDWHLAKVTVSPDTGAAKKIFVFNRWIEGGKAEVSSG
jgi:PLAT/LH2 domain